VNDFVISLAFRAMRLEKRRTQAQVAAQARISREALADVEHGRLDAVTVAKLRRIGEILGARVELAVRWHGGAVDRLVNAGHAAMHEALAQWLATLDGWEAVPEVSFSIWGERGVIDILAWHAASRSLLIIELKTRIVDINDLLGSMDRRGRLGPAIARERGWDPLTISRAVIVADNRSNRRRLSQHATVLRAAFPADGRELRGWLSRPVGTLSSLSFLPIDLPADMRSGVGRIRVVQRRRISSTSSSDAA